MAAADGISRPTYYNRVKSFARKAFVLAQSLKTAHAAGMDGGAPAPPSAVD